jgi:hypothetical protein
LVYEQYDYYIHNGYSEQHWSTSKYSNRPQFGVFCTCFFAIRMKASPTIDEHCRDVLDFLNLWSDQNRQFSNQDQLSLPYTYQKTGMLPFPLPGGNISGNYEYNSLFVKLPHGA